MLTRCQCWSSSRLPSDTAMWKLPEKKKRKDVLLICLDIIQKDGFNYTIKNREITVILLQVHVKCFPVTLKLMLANMNKHS